MPKTVTHQAQQSPNKPVKSLRKMDSQQQLKEPHEIPPVSWMDLLKLFFYYICLYTFYSIVWFCAWMLYKTTVSDKGPRYPHERAGDSRSALCPQEL